MPQVEIGPLLQVARAYHERARGLDQRPVGAAVLADDGTIHAGCNVQQRFRSHNVHAEVNAITTMVAEGCRRLVAIAIVAEGEGLPPCGNCLDWILQFGDNDCLVAWQGSRSSTVHSRRARELLPFHPPYDESHVAERG